MDKLFSICWKLGVTCAGAVVSKLCLDELASDLTASSIKKSLLVAGSVAGGVAGCVAGCSAVFEVLPPVSAGSIVLIEVLPGPVALPAA